MKILLDENFPLPLYRRLHEAGYEVEHIIVLGQRGLPDAAIRARLAAEELIFLTQDTEFEDLPVDYPSIVIIRGYRRVCRTKERVEIWFAAIARFIAHRPAGRIFRFARERKRSFRGRCMRFRGQQE